MKSHPSINAKMFYDSYSHPNIAPVIVISSL